MNRTSWYKHSPKEPLLKKNSTSTSPRTLLILLAAAAVVVAVLLAVLSQLGGGAGSSASNVDAGKLYSGIPENGTSLGESSAPVTIYLYEDFQCPICGQFSRETFPDLVNRDVRDGKVKVISEPMTFIGSDSVPAARAALAAGQQNRYWPYASLLFENQGQENSGYVTDDFLRGLAQKTPGLDVNQWNSDLMGNDFSSELQAAHSKAQADGVNATPTLIISGPNGQTKLVGLKDYAQISDAINQVDGS
jgi:protein-disulfide isomerase